MGFDLSEVGLQIPDPYLVKVTRNDDFVHQVTSSK